MCLIALSWRQHPDFPLVVVANRDEFFERPTAAAGWWPDAPEVLGGRDLRAGGSWLGVTRGGRLAALTNFRDPQRLRSQMRSRGELVAECLASRRDAVTLAEQVRARSADYNPFNLLVHDGATLCVLESVGGRIVELAPGLHGISNGLLDAPWPKVRRARARLARALGALPDCAALLAVLRDDRPAADAELPATGIPHEWERMLSTCFIRAPGYGTRSTTVVLFDARGGCRFVEQRWSAEGTPAGVTDEQFTLAG